MTLPVLLRDLRHSAYGARVLVLDLVDLLVLGVDGADQHVVGDVLEVAAELEPGSGGGDVVGGALALHLDQHAHVLVRVQRVLLERGQQLQSIKR